MSSSHDEQQQLDLESGLAKPHQSSIANNNNNNNNSAHNNKEQHLASAESSPESAPDDSGSGKLISLCYKRAVLALYNNFFSVCISVGTFFAGKGGMQGLARRLFGGSSAVNPTGGQRPSLQVFPTVSMLRISVTDSGAGISKVRTVTICE